MATDRVELEREHALRFGATHAAATMAEALDLVSEITRAHVRGRRAHHGSRGTPARSPDCADRHAGLNVRGVLDMSA